MVEAAAAAGAAMLAEKRSTTRRKRRNGSRTKRKPKAAESSDEESEEEVDLPGSWQGPINLEPFDGGLGLEDEELPEDQKAQEREARLFPGPMRPTDQFWRRRVRVRDKCAQDCSTDALPRG